MICDIHLTWLGTCRSFHCIIVLWYFCILVFHFVFCALSICLFMFLYYIFPVFIVIKIITHTFLPIMSVLFIPCCQYNGILCNCQVNGWASYKTRLNPPLSTYKGQLFTICMMYIKKLIIDTRTKFVWCIWAFHFATWTFRSLCHLDIPFWPLGHSVLHFPRSLVLVCYVTF